MNNGAARWALGCPPPPRNRHPAVRPPAARQPLPVSVEALVRPGTALGIARLRLQAGDSGSAAPNTGIYSAQATLATYARLCELAGPGLEGGHRVVLDATFLQRRQRDQARALAARHGAPFVILDFELDVTSLRRRIVERSARGGDASDADLAVLAAQMRDAQVLGEDERPAALACRAGLGREGTRIELDWAELRRRLPAAD